MQFTFGTDDSGRLVWAIAEESGITTVTSAEPATAAADLIEALDQVTAGGQGECFWREAEGEYRWMFRREGERLRVVVLWSTGTLTGWEHVLWRECDPEPFLRQMRIEAERHLKR